LSIKAIIDEFRKSSILAKGEAFEEQVRYDVLMALVLLGNKCSIPQLKAEAARHLAAKQRSEAKTEGLWQDYLEHSKSRYFKPREHLDDMRAPFYVPGTPGGSGGRHYDYGNQDFTNNWRNGTPSSTLHADQMSTVEEAYEFRKSYFPLYIKILQDILQDA